MPGRSFDISKWEVWDAWLQVQENQGGPGVDGVTIEEFGKDLKDNLYRVWNRMTSGSYFPPPVKGVFIPKAGGSRLLGVPTVSDRIAQTVVAKRIEQVAEPLFHADSYGYRPGRSALDAVGVCRQRCWGKGWVIDLDVARFFDSVDHELMVKAVEHLHLPAWVVLYVKRWLVADMRMPDGVMVQRERGTPQGSGVSPVLANLFLHYAFDTWLTANFPDVQFERFADDAVVHVRSFQRAKFVLDAIRARLAAVGLELHPDKTRIVYCGLDQMDRPGVVRSFDFLGYTFRRRGARSRKGNVFTSFLPAASDKALKAMSAEVRSWKLHRKMGYTFVQIAKWVNPIVVGWMNYYGAFYKTAMYPVLQRINWYLMRWVRKKYRRFRTYARFKQWWKHVTATWPRLFRHWAWMNAT